MALLCFLYFIALTSCIGVAALLAEKALPVSAPRRWLWAISIIASLTIPVAFSVGNSQPVIAIGGYTLLALPSRHAMSGMSHSSLNVAWLDCSKASYGATFLELVGVGSLLLLAWAVASELRVSYLLRVARRQYGTDAHSDGVRVVLTDSLGPATFGMLSARVLIPRWVLALPAQERRYVIRHEEEHRRARDPLLLAVTSILVTLLAWNPALWWQLRKLRLAIETDCDQRVVRGLGDATSYGELLFKVAEASSRTPMLQPAFLGRAGSLERRLQLLLRGESSSLFVRVASGAVAAALIYIVLTTPHPLMR